VPCCQRESKNKNTTRHNSEKLLNVWKEVSINDGKNFIDHLQNLQLENNG
jgi:hypothetical protein